MNTDVHLGRMFGIGVMEVRLFEMRIVSSEDRSADIVLPVHDGEGRLAGCVRRTLKSTAFTSMIDLYRIPRWLDTTEILFNLHRVKGCQHLFVVETPIGAIRLHSLGVPAVALMGDTISSAQCKLLKSTSATRFNILLDRCSSGCGRGEVLLGKLAALGLTWTTPEMVAGDSLETCKKRVLQSMFTAMN